MTQSSSNSDLTISFEVFPAKDESSLDRLAIVIRKLATHSPDFVSVTYGAGGTSQERSIETIERIMAESCAPVAGHLTCVGATRAQVDATAEAFRAAGSKHIVALRGDTPDGVGQVFKPAEGGYKSAVDLVDGLARLGGFEISVGAYPEKHPDSSDWDADIDNLVRKIDAGANRAITQFFFDNDCFYRFRDRVTARGVSVPIVPGVLPIANFTQVSRFSKACGTSIPDAVARRFAGLEDDLEMTRMVSAALATEQVVDLYDNGVRDFHFYTLNRADLTGAVCHLLRQHAADPGGNKSLAA